MVKRISNLELAAYAAWTAVAAILVLMWLF